MKQSISSLQLNHLSLSIGAHTILDNINTPNIVSGEILALIGPNGAGKSSLMQSICGLKNYSGNVLFNQTIIDKKANRRKSWINQIGYVPQRFSVSAKLSVNELLLLTQKANQRSLFINKKEIKRVADILNTLKIIHLGQQDCTTLSGGQLQLVALAQAMISNPSLLLLDEPTSALDLRHQLEVLQNIRDFVDGHHTEGKTPKLAVIVVHDLNLALRYADKILILEKGSCVAYGKAENIMTINHLKKYFHVDGELLKNSLGESVINVLRPA